MTRRFPPPALRDWFWPRLDPLTSQQVDAEARRLAEGEAHLEAALAGLTDDEPKLKDLLAATTKALDDENSRRGSVEARLLSIAGLFSVAGAVVLGTLVSIAGDATPVYQRSAVVLIALCCLYLAAQLAFAIHASIVGVRTTGYTESKPYELIPAAAESMVAFMRRRIHENLTRLEEHRSTNNRKASQLNLAHCAVRNVIAGLAALAIVAFLGSFLPRKLPAVLSPAQAVPASAPAPAATAAVPLHVQVVRIVSIGPFTSREAMPKKLDADLLRRCAQGAMNSASLGRVLQYQVTGYAPSVATTGVGSKAALPATSLALQRASGVAALIAAPTAAVGRQQFVVSVRAAEATDAYMEGVDVTAFVERTVGLAARPLPVHCVLR